MKTIVFLTCPKVETVCTGAGCFSALNHRTQQFARYSEEEVRVLAFMKCSGCGHFPGKNRGLDEKIERILAMRPDAVHVGVCCCHDGASKELCKEARAVCTIFEENGISVVHGTHSVF